MLPDFVFETTNGTPQNKAEKYSEDAENGCDGNPA